MNKTVKLSLTIILIILVIFGCMGKQRPPSKIDYYSLDYESTRFNDLKPTPLVLRIERFTVAPVYNTSNIIYKTGKAKRDAYNYHKWLANPGDMVTSFLARDLKNSSLFKAIFEPGARFSSSHIIAGTVDEFFEQDERYFWKAVLSVTITLMKEYETDISKRIIFQKRYKTSERCKRKNPRGIAEAMSTAMSRVSEKIITDVYHSLSIQK
jgi:cholesterol transport system auxiliary component